MFSIFVIKMLISNYPLNYQASYGRREIEIAEQEMPGIMALRKKASVNSIDFVYCLNAS